ncbi:MAG: 3'(2'),5'-bisphosphate nucleotidase CysQ [Nitratireductor sp.]|nr:3'(2'),5'-bisphosphate nucleotidase CysQ [Nitratireductor sp.]
MTSGLNLQADLDLMLDAATVAGDLAMGYFRSENRSWTKQGNSPVSEADVSVDNYLRQRLLEARPQYGWLSEETVDTLQRKEHQNVFIIDPIDGTRGFLEGNPRWCISMAVVRDGRPVVAVLHCPALGETYCAVSNGGTSLNGKPLHNPVSDEILRITASRKLNAEMQEIYPGRFDILPYVPSLAYRMAMVASGVIDGAFARSGAHDWDMAAADLLIAETGGSVTSISGEQLIYNRTAIRAPALVAAGPGRSQKLLALAKSGGFLQ